MTNEIMTGLLVNTGVLSLCALLVTSAAASNRKGFYEVFEQRRSGRFNGFGLLTGLVFGLTAAMLIAVSLRIDIGSVVDARAAPLILSGLIGGPLAAAVAAGIAGLARFAVGDPFVWGGVLSIAIYAAMGLIAGRLVRIDLRRPGLASLGLLVVISLVATISVLPAFFVDHDIDRSLKAVANVYPMILLQNPIAILLLGGTLKLTLRIVSDQENLARLSLELKKSNAQLNAQNRKLLDFSAIAAHDLKAPVVRIASLTEFLREDLIGANVAVPGTVKQEIDCIADSADAMRRLIDDLANYSFVQNSIAVARDFDTAGRTRDLLGKMALPPGFTVSVDANMPRIHVAPEAFDIVMRNLIANAVKHHDRDSGHIAVSGRLEGGAAVIEVADDGPGVEPQFLERIFRPLERLNPGRSDGSGLGLSFVSGLTSAWGGAVRAAPALPRGLKVSITAPAAVGCFEVRARAA